MNFHSSHKNKFGKKRQ